MGEDEARRKILARRAYFVAFALAGACGDKGEKPPAAPPRMESQKDVVLVDAGARDDAAPPPTTDSHGDGIPDAKDACPTAPGEPNADDKKNGCPVCLSIVLTPPLEIVRQVRFAARSASLLPAGFPILHEVADALRVRPYLTIEIAGHSDSTEPAVVAEQRARAVRDYLVTREGIDAARLHAKGYGATKPFSTNNSVAGREANRRVEFSVESP